MAFEVVYQEGKVVGCVRGGHFFPSEGASDSLPPPPVPIQPNGLIPNPVPATYNVTSLADFLSDKFPTISARLPLSFLKANFQLLLPFHVRFSSWSLARDKTQVCCFLKPVVLSSPKVFLRVGNYKKANTWVCVVKCKKSIEIVQFTPSSSPPCSFPPSSDKNSLFNARVQTQLRQHRLIRPALRLCKISMFRKSPEKHLGFFPRRLFGRFPDRHPVLGYSNKYSSPDKFLSTLQSCWPQLDLADDRVPLLWHYACQFSLFDRPIASFIFLNIPFQVRPHGENPYVVRDFLQFCWSQFLTHQIPFVVLTSALSIASCSKLVTEFKIRNQAAVINLTKAMKFQNPEGNIRKVSPAKNSLIVFGAQFCHVSLDNACNGDFNRDHLIRLVSWAPGLQFEPKSPVVDSWRRSYDKVHCEVVERNKRFESRRLSNLQDLSDEAKSAFFVDYTPQHKQAFRSSCAKYERAFQQSPHPDIQAQFQRLTRLKERDFVQVPAKTIKLWDAQNANKKRTTYKSGLLCRFCLSPGHLECPWLVPRAQLNSVYQQQLWDFIDGPLPLRNEVFCVEVKPARELCRELHRLLVRKLEFWELFSAHSGIPRNELPKTNDRVYARDLNVADSGILNKMDFWWAAGCNRVTLKCLIDGAPIFPNKTFPGHRYAQDKFPIDQTAHPILMSKIVDNLMYGYVLPIPQQFAQIVCNRFVIHYQEDARGKLRIIYDARILNHFLDYIKFRLPSWRDVMFKFGQDAKVFSIDLKSAYNQVPIMTASMPFCSFRVPCGKSFKYYAYTSLPFGVSSAPRIFFSLVKDSIVRFLNSNGWVEQGCAVAFLDDLLIKVGDKSTSVQECRARMTVIVEFIAHLGFKLNQKGSQGVTTAIEWCGMMYDFTNFEIFPGKNRFENCMATLRNLMESPMVSLSTIETFGGQLASWGPLNTKFAQCLKAEASDLLSAHRLSSPHMDPVQYEKSKLSTFVCITRLKQMVTIFFDILSFKRTGLQVADPWGKKTLSISTDASDIALGVTYRFDGKVHELISIPFSRETIAKKLSSTHRELLGTESAFLHLLDRIRQGAFPAISGCRYVTDNRGTIDWLKSGKAPSIAVQSVLHHTLLLSDLINIPFSFHWSRRNEIPMQVADGCSRIASNKIFDLTYFHQGFFRKTRFEMAVPFTDKELFLMNSMIPPRVLQLKLKTWDPRAQPVALIPFFRNTNLANILQVMDQCEAFGLIIAPCFYLDSVLSRLIRCPWKAVSSVPFPIAELGIHVLGDFVYTLKSFKPRVFTFDFRKKSFFR